MNKRQKLVQQQFLNNEEAVIKRLKKVYSQSYNDITKKVKDLDESIAYLQEVYDGIKPDGLTGAALDYFESRGQKISQQQAEETIKSMLQSKVYQKNYQEALQKQVDGILDKMHTNEFKTVSAYLNTCYEDGFIGAMFDLQGQGIPLCFPLDQEAMVRAVQLDSKISQGLYSRMGEDVAMLKKHITAQVSRGVANGMSYEKIAQQIGFKMLGTYDTPGGAYAKALRIARTEGHRIQVQGTMDACFKAKEKGADVVKQWDATLDDSTRESHQKVDGEIRELDKAFSNGLMFPGDPSGGASEVVNCRCALLQRARWGLDEAELQTLKERAKYFGLDKSDTFEDYKKKYLNASKELTNISNSGTISTEEMFRKIKDQRRDFKFISDEHFNNLTIEARKKGANIIRGTEEIEKHLDLMEAAASTIGDTLLFRKNVCVSEVVEETQHFMQNINGINNDKGEPLRTLLNEISAKQYLLDNASKYKIPRNECELTQKQLDGYKKQLKEYYNKGGG